MCAAASPHACRVRHSLASVLPGCSFDDEVMEYLASALEGGEQLSEDYLVEQWSPFLISACPAYQDDDEIRRVCRGLLEHLDGDGDGIDALVQWLEKVRLEQYAPRIRLWLEEHGVARLGDLGPRWSELADHLNMKALERRRFERALEGHLPQSAALAARCIAAVPGGAEGYPAAAAAGGAALEARGGVAASAAGAAAGAAGARRRTFGPAEDPERYSLREVIGEGATAKVCRCLRGDEVFAVKTISLTKLRFSHRDVKWVSNKFQREVSILFSLRHPRIASLYEVVEEPGQALYLVMEIVEGGDLFRQIEQHGSFAETPGGPKPFAPYVALQIADALAYVHSKDIVYRDLKPENILVDLRKSSNHQLEVKLSDFGHSKMVNDGYSVARTAGVGTPQYWAPEVSDPRKAALGYDQSVDLWSFGVVIYVMLVGRYPFVSSSSGHDRHSVPHDVSWAQLSLRAQDLITSLIQVAPRERLALAGCLSHPWVTTGRGADSGQAWRKPPKDAQSPVQEVRIPLPARPSKETVKLLRSDVVEWQKRFCCPATLKNVEVIVCYGAMEEERREHAHQELVQLLEKRFRSTSSESGHERRAAPV